MKYVRFPAFGLVSLVVVLTCSSAAPAVTGLIDKDTVTGDRVTATTTNGLLTVNASPRPFSNSSLNIGIAGGLNNASVDTYTGVVERLDWVFDPSVGFLSFKTAWTDGDIHLDGFLFDPQAYVITDPGISTNAITIEPFDFTEGRVVVNHPWQADSIAEIGFSNVAASAGQTISVYVGDTGIDRPLYPQVGINELAYTDPSTQTPVYLATPELTGNASATTDDGLVVLTSSPRDFAAGGNFFGVIGGSNGQALDNNVDGGTNAVPGEIITLTFDESVGPLSFSTIWTRGLIVLDGFSEDPELFVIGGATNITIYPYDTTNNAAALYHPWIGNLPAVEIGFGNSAAGAGQTIRMWIWDPSQPNPQVAIHQVLYGTPPLAIDSVALGAGPELVIRWLSQSGEFFAVEGAGDITNQWSAIETNITATPPSNTYAVAATPDRQFVRVAKEVPSGVLFSDDLEAGDTTNRWTSTADNGLAWEWGAPSPLAPPPVGPSGAHSGSNCYGTDLDGPYGTYQDPTLRSPAIDLTGVVQADLTFHHFQDIEESESGSGTPWQFDYGFVNVLRASDGSLIQANVFQTEGTSTDWEPEEVALPATAMGQEIVLEFGFHADGVQSPLQGGWYIDDIRVEAP